MVLNAISGSQGKLVEEYIKKFRSPVHEEITHLAYKCDDGVGECDRRVANEKQRAPRYVLEGVQWNDNPPFQLSLGQARNAPTCVGLPVQLPNLWPGCWGQVFSTAAQLSAPPGDHVIFGPESPILQRSHFGDMQFLHAMAPDGELAFLTQRKIMAWARFVYEVSEGRIAANAIVSTPAAGSGAQFFPPSVNSAYAKLDVTTLFTLGSSDISPQRVKDMAFGSLLHIIEDSFSKAHVQREPAGKNGRRWPGRVEEFHSYAHQDHNLHSDADGRAAFQAVDTKEVVIEAVRRVVDKRGAKWDEIEPILTEIFDVVDRGRPAGPGDEYKVKVSEPARDDQAP